MQSQKAALIILDGWGHGQVPSADAIKHAKTPFVDSLYSKYPHSELVTFGEEVGLPDGQMGNSEVGHLNIGAGRIVYQELARINKAAQSGELARNKILLQAIKKAVAADVDIHLLGLVSDGGVHSHVIHLKSLVDIIEENDGKKIFIHSFMDGRDTSPTGGVDYLRDLSDFVSTRHTELASVIGRYFAMDRDKRWERIKKAYDLLVHGKGAKTQDILAAMQKSYDAGITDEFIEPMVITNADGAPKAQIKPGDLVICFNFRTDRPRQLSYVLTQADLPEFGMKTLDINYVTMTRYDDTFQGIQVIFEKALLTNTMGEILEKNNKTQLRMAETEKYPHVTFFFSGGREAPYKGEHRILIPSPKVATYDLQPEMSAIEVTEAILDYVKNNAPDFICLNYANADMVGHTGVFEAAMKAASTVDRCLEKLIHLLLEKKYKTIIIADHGNSDFLINEDGSPNTAHTKNPVPCILVSDPIEKGKLHNGKLADIAPTLLHLMGIDIPKEMDGKLLVG